MTKWFWANTTQVFFGKDAVKEHLHKFVTAGAKVICTFGGGSIDKNGCRADVQSVLDELKCEVIWEGGICPNPEYDRLMEIVAVVRAKNPDLILSVGGGSVCDATKFICAAAALDPSDDAWDKILGHNSFPEKPFPFGAVMTLPATGSEWNPGFVISRRSTQEKLAAGCPRTYPVFSLLDPAYTMSLPLRQIKNGVYDALIHCIDRYVTPQVVPMFDNFWLSVVQELLTIGPQLLKPDASIELHERLMCAALFAINGIFSLEKTLDRGIHIIGHMLTAKYGIDHAATLSMVCEPFLENQLPHKTALMARSGEVLFNATGTDEEKARAFIKGIAEFTKTMQMPTKVSDWEGATVSDGDVEQLVRMVMKTTHEKPFGYNGCCTEADTRAILTKCVI